MSREYDNNMRGVLFKNEDKETDKHPDYKGQGEIDRKQVWISAWIKTPKAGGTKFMSLSFQFKTAQQGGSRTQSAPDPDEPF
jgi:hypothetical protein